MMTKGGKRAKCTLGKSEAVLLMRVVLDCHTQANEWQRKQLSIFKRIFIDSHGRARPEQWLLDNVLKTAHENGFKVEVKDTGHGYRFWALDTREKGKKTIEEKKEGWYRFIRTKWQDLLTEYGTTNEEVNTYLNDQSVVEALVEEILELRTRVERLEHQLNVLKGTHLEAVK